MSNRNTLEILETAVTALEQIKAKQIPIEKQVNEARASFWSIVGPPKSILNEPKTWQLPDVPASGLLLLGGVAIGYLLLALPYVILAIPIVLGALWFKLNKK